MTTDNFDMESKTKKRPRRDRNSPLAANLKLILAERGLSQKQAASLMDISLSVLHDWLQGTSPNDPMPILKLCQALSCDFQWMLTGIRSVPAATDNLHELFDIQDDPAFSRIFKVEAKRLKPKGK